MYNDFPIISENEMLKLKNAYNERFNRTKSLNLEENFIERFNKVILFLQNSLHYIENLLNLSKNLDNKNTLKGIQRIFLENIENLKILFEINEIENINDIENINNNNINSNIQKANFYLYSFLEELFYLVSYENNIKIKSALSNVYLSTLEQIKKLNNLIVITKNFKIVSLFKRY